MDSVGQCCTVSTLYCLVQHRWLFIFKYKRKKPLNHFGKSPVKESFSVWPQLAEKRLFQGGTGFQLPVEHKILEAASSPKKTPTSVILHLWQVFISKAVFFSYCFSGCTTAIFFCFWPVGETQVVLSCHSTGSVTYVCVCTCVYVCTYRRI